MTYEEKTFWGYVVLGVVVLGIAWAVAWGCVRTNTLKAEAGYIYSTHHETIWGER